MDWISWCRGFIFCKVMYLLPVISAPSLNTACPSIQQCTADIASHFLLPSILAELVSLVSTLASDTTVKVFERTRWVFVPGIKSLIILIMFKVVIDTFPSFMFLILCWESWQRDLKWTGLKGIFIQKWKVTHYLLTPVPIGGVTCLSPQNTSGVSGCKLCKRRIQYMTLLRVEYECQGFQMTLHECLFFCFITSDQ